jgi:peptidoglycan/xylan/chitin deacetylase (PgdA/CDA1 family)
VPRGRRPAPWGRVALIGACGAALGLGAARALGQELVPDAVFWSLLVAIVGLVGVGVFVLPSGTFGRPLLGGDGSRPLVALTFDDGPDPTATRDIMTLLEERGHRGTFFVIGQRAAAERELVREIVRRGHGLGNHSYFHSHLTPFHSAGRLAAELEETAAVLAATAGVRPRWFRPPMGLLSPPVAEAARRAGLEVVGWTSTARDGWASTTPEAALARLERGLRPGAILVLHDAVERGARAPIAPAVLRRLLALLEERGLRSVTLDELLDRPPAP